MKNVFKTLGAAMSKHSPALLTGVGIAGMLTTTILAVRATPKALKLIENKTEDKGDKLTPVETVKTAWKPYIPAAISGVLSITCLIFAHRVNTRRSAMLMAAYELSENALTEYKDKAIEVLGEKKEEEIRTAIDKSRLEKDPITSEKQILLSGSGETLCYDALSGRYFKSSINNINSAVNELNNGLITEGTQCLNDYYDLIGLPDITIGYELSWDHSEFGDLIEARFTSHITSNGLPCVVVSLDRPPVYHRY